MFLHMDIHLFQHHLLKRLSFPPLNCLDVSVEIELTIQFLDFSDQVIYMAAISLVSIGYGKS
jgi:hypothetical protein